MTARAGLGGALATAIIFCILTAAAHAAPQDLDTTFGTNGVASGPVVVADGDPAFVVGGATRPDGSTYLVGRLGRSRDIIVVKYTPLGQRDTAFGPNGERRVVLPAGAIPLGVAVADSGIYVTGNGPVAGDGFVARIGLDTGQLVSSWGDPATPGVGNLGQVDLTAVTSIALQSFGDAAGARPVVLAQRPNHGVDTTILLRLGASGTNLDSTFGTNGIQAAGVGAQPVDLFANDNGIYALGASAASDSYTLARYAPANGATTLFGNAGRATGGFPATTTGTTSAPNAITADAQGRVYVAGRFIPADGDARAAIARYTSAGFRDTTFGTDALFTSNDPGTPAVIDLVADAQGILAAGAEGENDTRTGRTLVVSGDGQQLVATLRSGVAGDRQHSFVSRLADGRPVLGGTATGAVFTARFGGPNQAPTVTLTGPATARPSEAFTLTATGADDGLAGGLRHEWDVDGTPGFETSTGTDNTLETAVAATGPFTARVRVSDASGKTSSPAEHQVTIAGNAFPVAAFTVTPAAPSAGVSVLFDATGSADSDGTIQSYAWDLDGNGTTDATGVRPTFTYAAKGTYPVTLTVTDDTGAQDTETRNVVVVAAGAPPTLSEPQTVAVDSTSATVRFRVTENGHPAVDPEVVVGPRRFAVTPTPTPGVFEARITDLAPLTSYSWQPRVTDGDTGAVVTGEPSSFKTTNGAPVITANVPGTAVAGGAFLFSFEAHDDTTPDDQLKVQVRISKPPAAPQFVKTVAGGSVIYRDASFPAPGTHRLELVATDAQGEKTTFSRTVEVQPSPSFTLEGPTTEVTVAPGDITRIPFKILRDDQGVAPVRVQVRSKDAPKDVAVSLFGDSGFTTFDSGKVSIVPSASAAGKTFEVTVEGVQQPPPSRDIGPRSFTFEVRVIKPVDLVLEDVEVMQAVQRPLGGQGYKGGVPLIQGKTTLVRAYARYSGKPEANQVPVARLYMQGNKQPILPVYSPPKLFVGGFDADMQRPRSREWYHFLVPASATANKGLAAQYDFRVELDPPLAKGSGGTQVPMECQGCAGNNIRRRKDVKYLASPSFAVRMILARYTDGKTGQLRDVTGTEAQKALAPSRWVLPVARDEFTLVQATKTLNLGKGGTDWCQDVAEKEAGPGADPEDVDDEFRDCRSDIQDHAFDLMYASGVGKPPNGALLLLHEDFTPGVARSSQGIAQGNTLSGMRSVAHELTHIVGRQHADTICGGDDNGEDGEVLTDDFGNLGNQYGLEYPGSAPWPFVGPEYSFDPRAVDYMSYCSGTAWTSAEGWLLSRQLLFANASRRSAPRQAASGGGVRISAIVSGDTPRISRVRPVRPGEAAPAGAPSDWSFLARGAGGAVLGQVPGVTVSEDRPHEGGPATVPVLANLPEGTLSVDLVRGTDILDTRDASASAPAVQVATPAAPLGGSLAPVAVTWTASDPDGDPLDVFVDYSADGGATWEPAHVGIATGAGGTAELDPRVLRTAAQAKLRVTVTDGFRTTTAESGVFASRAAPATVSIETPGPAFRPRAGLPVSATATAIGPDGTPLTGKAVRWFLGRKRIGTGTEVLTPPLPAGRSKLRVVAGGASASRSLKAAAVKAFFTRLSGKRKGRRATVTVAASAAGAVRIAGKRYAVGMRAKTIRVRVGRRTRKLPVTLTATGSRARAKVRLR